VCAVHWYDDCFCFASATRDDQTFAGASVEFLFSVLLDTHTIKYYELIVLAPPRWATECGSRSHRGASESHDLACGTRQQTTIV
jgi:hypothetical protein